MKHLLIILTSLLILPATCLCQQLIAVHHNGSAAYYSSLTVAVDSALTGDTIFLPPGNINPANVTVNKELHFIGVGHNPDSTKAFGGHTILGGITLWPTLENSSFTGIYFNGGFVMNGNNDTIRGISISRCSFEEIYIAGYSQNILISECIIREGARFHGNGKTSHNILIQNSFVRCCINNNYSIIGSGTFRNNIFSNGGSSYPGSGKSRKYENNIFLQSSNQDGLKNGTFYNNLFVVSGFPYSNTAIGYGNIFGQDRDSIFVNNPSGYLIFRYDFNYHLKPGSPGINAGTDGTNIGIYGGASPFKWSTVPKHPHIIESDIGLATDSTGALPVQIKVEAQER